MGNTLMSGSAIVGAARRRPQATTLVALLLLPAALAARALAFASPAAVESWYARSFYPVLARGIGAVAALVPGSAAELLAPVMVGALVMLLVRRFRAADGAVVRRLGAVALAGWAVSGVIAWGFLLVWGFHYARPPLADRLVLDTSAIEAPEVLALGIGLAREARTLRAELGAEDTPIAAPAHLDFAGLDAALDDALTGLGLPGDPWEESPAPAKPLRISFLFARLGISGIYVPFTAEPSVNALVPAASLPVVMAHEKAHQRGITDEGEANLVAILAGLGTADPFLRYTAALDAAAQLVGQGVRYVDDERRNEAWSQFGPGPLTDLRAIHDFWASYEGAATEVAGRVNDAYLRANRVPGGGQSYGRVVRLLVGARRAGLLSVGVDDRPAAPAVDQSPR